MSKKQKTLLERAKELIAHIERTHEYSMSRIYGIYNEITGKREKPDSCPSCLIRRKNYIQTWIAEEEKRLVSVEPITDKKED